MALVALLPTLAAARAAHEPQTFESLCTMRAAAASRREDPFRDYYDTDHHYRYYEWRVCGHSAWYRSEYMSAAAIGSKAYFAPYSADHVGVVDVSSSTFSTISIPDDGVTNKYVGAAAIGATVYFSPFNEDNVGVLHTASSTFSTLRLDGVIRGGQNYADAVAVGTTLYMAPWSQDGVGVLDAATSTFSTIDFATPRGARNKYWGAAAIGTKAYFAPFYSVGVLVLDISTSTLSTISTSIAGRAYWGYAGALALGANVYFSPRCETNIGVLDTTTATFSIINITQGPWSSRECGMQKQPYFDIAAAALGAAAPAALNSTADSHDDDSVYDDSYTEASVIMPGPPSSSIAAIGTKVYVVPDGLREVGVLDTVEHVFSTINGTKTEQAYAGAVAVGSKIVFAPCVGGTAAMLRTSSATPPATASSPTPDCSDAASSIVLPPPSLPRPAPPEVLRPTVLAIALLSAGSFLCACAVLGALSYRAAQSVATLRRSCDRAQGDLQLLTHQARPHSWGPHATAQVSLPPAPPSASAGGSAAGDAAAVRGSSEGTAMSVTSTEAEQVLTLMEESELEQVLVNEMPGLAQQDKQELNPPQPDAAADEVAGLLEGVQQGEQPQSKRPRQNVSDEGSGGVAPQGCSSPGSSVDAPAASLEDGWIACSTSASQALAAARAHRMSVGGTLDARALSSSVHGTDDSTSASAESLGVDDGPAQQEGQKAHSAFPAPARQPVKEAFLGSRLHACKSCRRAKKICVDDQRPCARCVRLGLPCDEVVKPVKRACTNCSQTKVKCDLDAENDPCSRCRRLGLVCTPLDHTPSHIGRRMKRMSRSSSRNDDGGTPAAETSEPGSGFS